MRICLILFAAACFYLQAAAPSIQFEQGIFLVTNWSAPAQPPSSGWTALFAVYAGAADVPPLLGEYKVTSGTLTFKPRYSLTPGLRVRAVFQGVETLFNIPRVAVQSSTRVHGVYPTTATLPENQLKFYIEFTAPMSQGEAWKRIHLLKADGQPVDLPFLEIDQEMWDADGRRLTVLFDPGRIKRGVKPLEDIGPAIEAGHSYTLVVDRDWQDANGAPLLASHRKEFRVVEADRSAIVLSEWRIGTVTAGSRSPLVIDFPEPLDYALMQRMIWVDGVPGKVTIDSEERQWRFVSEQPWASGNHILKVDTALEDLAGNKVGRPFEVDTFERVSRRVQRDVISLPFRVRGQ